MKIAVITPINKRDYLTDTVLDGLGELGIDHKRSDKEERKSFVAYAREAELILFCWGKTVKKWRIFDFNNTNTTLDSGTFAGGPYNYIKGKLSVVSPTGPDGTVTWTVGSTNSPAIRWNKTGSIGNLKIEYSARRTSCY